MTVNIKFLGLQQMQFNLFKSQDPENGRFDVIFEVEGKVSWRLGFKGIIIVFR